MNAKQKTSSPRKWTLAEVVAANKAGGGYFFSRGTLMFFGETLKSFRIVNEAQGGVFVVRKSDGKIWRFSPDTGHISTNDTAVF